MFGSKTKKLARAWAEAHGENYFYGDTMDDWVDHIYEQAGFDWKASIETNIVFCYCYASTIVINQLPSFEDAEGNYQDWIRRWTEVKATTLGVLKQCEENPDWRHRVSKSAYHTMESVDAYLTEKAGPLLSGEEK